MPFALIYHCLATCSIARGTSASLLSDSL